MAHVVDMTLVDVHIDITVTVTHCRSNCDNGDDIRRKDVTMLNINKDVIVTEFHIELGSNHQREGNLSIGSIICLDSSIGEWLVLKPWILIIDEFKLGY